MKRRSPVEPVDHRSIQEQAVAALVHEGCPKPDAVWLAHSLMDPGVLPAESASTPDGELTFTALCRLELFARQFKSASDRDVAILMGFDKLGIAQDVYERQPNYGPWPFLEAEAQRFLDVCCGKGIDFTRAFHRAHHQSKYLPHLASALARHGCLDIAALIDPEKLDALADRPGWWPTSHGSSQAAQEDCDPTTLVFWLARIGAPALDAVIPRLEQAGTDSFARLARGVAWSIGSWMMRPGSGGDSHGPTGYLERGPTFAACVQRVFEELDRRVQGDPAKADLPLRRLWFRYAWMSFDRRPETMDSSLQRRIYSAAADEIGRMRPLFRAAAQPGSVEQFEALRDHYSCCVGIVFGLGNLWQALKPVLLAFCSLRAQAVATDLRFWWEQDRDGPEQPAWLHWSIVPMNVAAAIHNYSGREQRHDPDLENARSDFASFCLSRLKSAKRRATSTNRGDAESEEVRSLVEPDPNWRECLIRAVRELRVNPGGKGHNILHHVSQHDPDDGVRKAAKLAYAEMRRGWGSDRKVSPRTMLLAAFWWLRQGHLLSLDIEPDRNGAQRTRDQERRRTTEPEPDDGL